MVVMALFAGQMALAQQMQQRTPEERAQNQTHWMQKNLGITEDQNRKVYDIILKYARQAGQEKNEAPGREKRQEMQQTQNAKDAELKAVLTGDQYQKYQAHVAEMKDKMRERRQMQE